MSMGALRRRRFVQAAVAGEPPIPESISIALSPSTQTVAQSGTTTLTVTLTRLGGYTGTVTPGVSGLPTGVTGSFSDLSLTGAEATTVLTLSAAADATVVSNDAFTVTCSGAGVSDAIHNATVTVTVPATFGPGPNAPAWIGKTTYPEELFNTPIPAHYNPPNTAGFQGFQGFTGAYGGAVYDPVRVTYPTVSTPIGTKPVMQVLFPGSTGTISAVNGTTVSWTTRHDWGIRITGTWSGTMTFERSLDEGVTWNPVTLRGTRSGDGLPNSATGSSTTVNGVWVTDTDYVNQLSDTGIFRVRASALASGTATVAVGMRGGEAPARFTAGEFTGRPTRIYTRLLVANSVDWSNGTNVGTKGFFYQGEEGRGHYTSMFGDDGVSPSSGLQFNVSTSGTNRNMGGTELVSRGVWADIEFVFVANTLGSANGVFKAWINNVLSVDLSDVSFFQAEATLYGFVQFFMDPTYGGGEAPPDNNNIFFRIGGWYRESAP